MMSDGIPASERKVASPIAGWLAVSLVVVGSGCGPRIEEEPPVPEHRLEPCRQWCGLIFDPECPQEVEVKTEEECFEGCIVAEHIWAPVSEDEDACAVTYIPYADCMASLSCSERDEHFALTNVVPPSERSPCGELLQAQLDCQSDHY